MNRSFLPSLADTRALIRLAVPIVVVQVGLMAMGVVDTIIVGHVSATELAAAALGHLYFFGTAIFGMGVLMVIDPVISQAVGAGEREAVARGIQRGLLLALVVTLPLTVLFAPVQPVLHLLRQPAEVVPRAAGFAQVSAPSLFPLLAFVVLRQSLQAMRHMRPIVVTIVGANVLNAALNYVFVFGRFGSPALGAVGSALASTVSRWIMLGALLALAWRELRPLLVPVRPAIFQRAPLVRMLALGLPIGIQFMLEFGAFAVIALLAGWFGPEAMAGHQVAINLASLTFMVPLGVSSAAAVMVGHAIGAREPHHARRVAATALACGAAFMGFSALFMRVVPGPLAGFYTSDAGVFAVAAALIPIAGVFQVFDGLQVVAAGVLRGAGDTRAPMIVNVLGFWLVGMPVSLWFGFHLRGGVIGLWWGFVAGLAAVATILVLRVRVRLLGTLERVRVEEATDPVTAA